VDILRKELVYIAISFKDKSPDIGVLLLERLIKVFFRDYLKY